MGVISQSSSRKPQVAFDKSHKWLSTVAEISITRGAHFLANLTIEKIGNEAEPLLKCVDVSITSSNKATKVSPSACREDVIMVLS